MRSGSGLLLLILIAGCAPPPAPPRKVDPPAALGGRYDPTTTGAIAGRIAWDGPLPEVAPLHSPPSPSLPPPREPSRPWPHPYRPLIESVTNGVGDVVVFLRGVDLERSKPWAYPPVRVEVRDRQLHLTQGDSASRVGFVRRGERVEMVSREKEPQLLHLRGADYFTVPFVDPDRPAERLLNDSGVVELVGGAGRFWMRGFLFVDEHPYLARTDGHGDYVLENVPEGEYDLVTWMPRWQVERVEYDPSWNLASRVTFRPPLEVVRRIRVRRGETTQVDVRLSADLLEH